MIVDVDTSKLSIVYKITSSTTIDFTNHRAFVTLTTGF